MVEELNNYLVGIVVGIRFRANFAVEDQLGKILDTILYSKNSFFGPKVFSAARSGVGKKMLHNDTTNDMLTIDNSNIIVQINFTEDKSGFRREDVDKILQKIDEQIIKGVMKDFDIREIMRVGYIKRYIFPIEGLAKSFVNKTIGSTLDGVNDINLSFSKKSEAGEALMKKDVNDYDNAIFNIIKSADKNEIFMAVDYQSYYDPFLPSYHQIEFDKFIQRADVFNRKKYLPWLNKNYVEA